MNEFANHNKKVKSMMNENVLPAKKSFFERLALNKSRKNHKEHMHKTVSSFGTFMKKRKSFFHTDPKVYIQKKSTGLLIGTKDRNKKNKFINARMKTPDCYKHKNCKSNSIIPLINETMKMMLKIQTINLTKNDKRLKKPNPVYNNF